MPFKSKAQARLFFAAAKGKSDKIDKETAEKYIEDSKGSKFPSIDKVLKKKKKNG